MPKVLNLLFSFCLLLCWGCKSAKIETIDFSDGSYEGELNSKKQKHGKGFFRWSDGSYFNGEYVRDQRHGEGRFLWANGETYDGDYLEDQRTGRGVYRWPDGSVYEGLYFKGKRHGNGNFTASDGIRYEGEWLHDVQHGKGKLIFPNGNVVAGTWMDGKLVSSNSVPPPTSTRPMIEVDEIPSVDIPAQSKPVDLSPTLSPVNESKNKSTSSSNSSTVELAIPDKAVVADATPTPPSSAVLPVPPPAPIPTAPQELTIPEEKGPKEKINLDFSKNETSDAWRGTAADAESQFTTELLNGLDTIKERDSNLPFSGKMLIVDQNGLLEGELNLLNGVLHGMEIFFDSNGKVLEENLWKNGRKVD